MNSYDDVERCSPTSLRETNPIHDIQLKYLLITTCLLAADRILNVYYSERHKKSRLPASRPTGCSSAHNQFEFMNRAKLKFNFRFFSLCSFVRSFVFLCKLNIQT